MDRSFITVVSGANRGIGQAIVQTCANRKLKRPMVIYAASRGGVDLDLEHSSDVQIQYPKLDITDKQSILDLVAEIKQKHGGIDVLINNAGLNITRPSSGLRAFEDQKKIMDVNFRGTLQMCRSFLPIVKGHGRIVNLSSLASSLEPYSEINRARFRNPRLSMSDLEQMAVDFEASAKKGDPRQDGWSSSGYSMSKACINAMAAILGRENPSILVNACCPGWVSTQMGHQVGAAPPKTPLDGASIPVRLAFDNIGGSSGRYWANSSMSSTASGDLQEW